MIIPSKSVMKLDWITNHLRETGLLEKVRLSSHNKRVQYYFQLDIDQLKKWYQLNHPSSTWDLCINSASYRSSVLELFASKIMSTPLITIFPNGSIRDAMDTMLRNNIRRLVVIEPPTHYANRSEDNISNKVNSFNGIVTDKDIFKAIINNQDFVTEILSDRSFISHKDLLERLGENLLGEGWRR